MEQHFNSHGESIYIQHIPFSNLLNAEQKKEIIGTSNLVNYTKRDIILKQNTTISHIPVLISGYVKITKEMRKGKNIILRVAEPSCFLGLSSVYSSETYDYSVIALDPVSVVFINSTVLKKIVEQNGEFGFRIIEQLSKDNIFNINKLSSLLYKQLPGRVADIILYFAEQIFKSNTFTIPLTRLELAELAGTTKESLIRTLSEFNNDKIIEMNRNSITIISINILRTLSRLG